MKKKKPTTTLNYNIGQLRVDTWNSLKAQSVKLAKADQGSATCEKQQVVVEDLLRKLAIIERYFAFPGLATVKSLQNTFKQGEYVSISHKTNHIVHLLVSDNYRNHSDLQNQQDWAKASKKSSKRSRRRMAIIHSFFLIV